MKQLRKIIEINEELCDGCGQCLPNCAEGSLAIVDGKAKLVAENLCDGLGACLGVCPQGALKIIEREADEFDEEAVEAYLKQSQAQPSVSCQSMNAPQTLACGCAGDLTRGPVAGSAGATNWPVKLRLIPPSAPFLRDANLLITADCCPIACRDIHEKYFDGHVVLAGCPKFDEKEGQIQRLTEIFREASPKSITLLIMEVPCCSAFVGIVREALKTSGRAVPTTIITISRQGGALGEEVMAA